MKNCKQCKNLKEYIPEGRINAKSYCCYKKRNIKLKEMNNNSCFDIDSPALRFESVKDILKRIYEEHHLEKEVCIPLFHAYLDNTLNINSLDKTKIINRFLSEYIPEGSVANLKKPYYKNRR